MSFLSTISLSLSLSVLVHNDLYFPPFLFIFSLFAAWLRNHSLPLFLLYFCFSGDHDEHVILQPIITHTESISNIQSPMHWFFWFPFIYLIRFSRNSGLQFWMRVSMDSFINPIGFAPISRVFFFNLDWKQQNKSNISATIFFIVSDFLSSFFKIMNRVLWFVARFQLYNFVLSKLINRWLSAKWI